MELAVITDEIDNDFEHALDVMLEYGIRGAEVRQIWDKNIAQAPQEYLDRAKRALETRNMHVVGIASPFFKCDFPDQATDNPGGPLHSATALGLSDQIGVLDRCMAAAKFFDTDLIRVFSFWKRGPLTPEIEDRIIDAFVEPIALAGEAGMVLGLENEGSCYLGTGAQTARVLEKIGSPRLRAIWDPSNAYFDGEKPYPTGYEAIKSFIRHVHIKDAGVPEGKSGPEHMVVGQGAIDWKGQLKALIADGYQGYLSLETHYHGHPTKEASSRACLDGIRSLLASIGQ